MSCNREKASKKQIFESKRKYFKNIPSILSVVIVAISISCASCAGLVKQERDKRVELENTVDATKINQHKDGKKNGLWREFYDTGQLKTEGSYTLDKKNGIHREWEENGILLLEGYYAEGKANGLMKWYHEGGHLAAEGNMIDDVRIGNWKICDIEDNGFCIEAHFKNGMRDGIWKIYHENARDKLWKEQTFKEDRMISERCWDEKGKQIECQ